MNRVSDECVARHDGAVRAQPAARPTRIAVVTRDSDALPLAGTEEIQPAHLESVRQLPDAVERGAMALIGGRERIFAAEIGSQLEIRRVGDDLSVGVDEPE